MYDNPRDEYEHDCTLCIMDNRYFGGDKNDLDFNLAPEVLEKKLSENYIWSSVYAYIHSGVTISLDGDTYPFNDIFDAGKCGYIIISKKKVKELFNVSQITDDILEKVQNMFENEIKEFDMYLTGDYDDDVDEE